MTDMIAQDLQDMAHHPFRALLAGLLTALALLSCPIVIGVLVWHGVRAR